jgi:hypothetical protein
MGKTLAFTPSAMHKRKKNTMITMQKLNNGSLIASDTSEFTVGCPIK